MSAWDDIISKRLTPGTGPIGVKGIKPIHAKPHVCTKTLTEMGRVRYICPPSGGKQAVRSLENLPVKPEDVPEKTKQIAAFSPEQQYTPKEQRENPEKIKQALLKRPTSVHLDSPKEAEEDTEHDHLHAKVPDEAEADVDKDTIHHEDPKEAKGPSPNLKDVLRKIAAAASEDEDGVKKSGPSPRPASQGHARAKARGKTPIKSSRVRRRVQSPRPAPKHKAPPTTKTASKTGRPRRPTSIKRGRGPDSTGVELASAKVRTPRSGSGGKSPGKGPSLSSDIASRYNLPESYTEDDFKTTQYDAGVRELSDGGFVIPGGNKTYESKEAAELAATFGGNTQSIEGKPSSSKKVEKVDGGGVDDNWSKLVKVNVPNKDASALKFDPPNLKWPKSFSVKHEGRVVDVDTSKPEFIAAAKTYTPKKPESEADKVAPQRLQAFLTRYVDRGASAEGDAYFKDYQQRKHDVSTKQARDERRGKFDSKLPKLGAGDDGLEAVDVNTYPGISKVKSGGFKAYGIDKMYGSADDAYVALHGKKPGSPASSKDLVKEFGGVDSSDLAESYPGGVRRIKSGGYATPKGGQNFPTLAEAQLSLPKGKSLVDKTLDDENWEAFQQANYGSGESPSKVKYPKTFRIRNSDDKVIEVDTSSKYFKNRVAQFWTPNRTTWQRKKYAPREILGKYLKEAAGGVTADQQDKDRKARGEAPRATMRADYSARPGKIDARTRAANKDLPFALSAGRAESVDPGGRAAAPRTAAEKAEAKVVRATQKKKDAIRHSKRSIQAFEDANKARTKRISEDGYDKEQWHGTIGEVSGAELFSTLGNAALWVLPGGAYVKGLQAAAKGGRALGATAKVVAGAAKVKAPKTLGRAIDTAIAAGTAVSKTVVAGKHVAQTVAHKGKTYALVGMIAHSSIGVGGRMNAIYATGNALKAPIAMSVKAAPAASKATGITAKTASAATQAAAKVAPSASASATASKVSAATQAADKTAKTSKLKAAGDATPQIAQAVSEAAAKAPAQAPDQAPAEAPAKAPAKAPAEAPARTAGGGTGGGGGPGGGTRPAAKKPKRRRRGGLSWGSSDTEPQRRPERRRRGQKKETSGREEADRKDRVAAAIARAKEAHTKLAAKDPSYSRIGARRTFDDILEARETEERMSRARMNKSRSFVAPFARRVRNKSMSLKAALDKVPWHMQDELLEDLRDKKRKKRRK